MSEVEEANPKPWFYRVKGSIVGPSMSTGKFVPASLLGTLVFTLSLLTFIGGMTSGIQAYRFEAWGMLASSTLCALIVGGTIWYGLTFRSEDHPYGY